MPNSDDNTPEGFKRVIQSIPRKHGKKYRMFLKLRQMLDEGRLSIDQVASKYRAELTRFTKDDRE